MKLFLLFLSVPIIEIIVFLKINEFIGIFYTVFFIMTTAIIGAIAVKRQGLGILIDIQNQPSNTLSLIKNGVLILIAGVLLLTPGFITDLIGFALLIPIVRKYILQRINSRFSQPEIY